MNTKKFISKDNIGALYKIVNKDHRFAPTNSKADKKKVIDVLMKNMKKVYKSLDQSKINSNNYNNIFKQFNKLSIDETTKELKENSNKTTSNKKYQRDFNSVPKKNVQVMERPIQSKNTISERNTNYVMDNNYIIPKNKFGAINNNSIKNTVESGSYDSMFQPIRNPSNEEKMFNNVSNGKGDMSNILKKMENDRKLENNTLRPPTPDFLKSEKVSKDEPTQIMNNNIINNQQLNNNVNTSQSSNTPQELNSFGGVSDDGYVSINSMNNSLKPSTDFVDDNISFEDRLKQLQSNRDVNIEVDNSGKNFEQLMEDKNKTLNNTTNIVDMSKTTYNSDIPNSNSKDITTNYTPQIQQEQSDYSPQIQQEQSEYTSRVQQEQPKYTQEIEQTYNKSSNQEYIRMVRDLQQKVQQLEEENNKLNETTTFVEELIKNVNSLKQENFNLKEQGELNKINSSILNQRENSLMERENELKKLLSLYYNINNKKTIQLNLMSEKGSNFIYKFDELTNVNSLRLLSYSIPKPRFNINKKNNVFQYSVNDMEKKITIPNGNYDINNLINYINNNDDFTISIVNQKLLLESKTKFEIDLENSYLIVNNLGFQKNTFGLKLKANKSWDLRLPDKLFLYLKNIDNDVPIGMLYFNDICNCEIILEKPISLDRLHILITDEDGILYDFNGLHYSLSFQVETIISSENDNKSMKSTLFYRD